MPRQSPSLQLLKVELGREIPIFPLIASAVYTVFRSTQVTPRLAGDSLAAPGHCGVEITRTPHWRSVSGLWWVKTLFPGDEEMEGKGSDALVERVYPNEWEPIELMKKIYQLAKKIHLWNINIWLFKKKCRYFRSLVSEPYFTFLTIIYHFTTFYTNRSSKPPPNWVPARK